MNNRIITILFMIVINFILFRQIKGETGLYNAKEYTKREMIFIKWGDDENEIELKEEVVEDITSGNTVKEIIRITPARIKIDGKGNIYFEDVVNMLEVKYDPQYKTIEKFEGNEGIFKVLIDREQDGLYFLNPIDNSVDIILSGKNRIRKIDRSISDYLMKSDLKIKNRVLFSGGRKKISFNGTDTADLKLEPEEPVREYDINAKNAVIKFKVIDPLFTLSFKNLKQIGASCDEIKQKIGFQMDYISFIEEDKDKNIYYLFSKFLIGPDEPAEYFVVKINLSLCEIELIPMEIDDFTGYMASPIDYVAVDFNGNIYQLLNKEDGVHVIRWSK